MLQNAQITPFKKHTPEPLSKRLATPRVASRFATCNSPSCTWQIMYRDMLEDVAVLFCYFIFMTA